MPPPDDDDESSWKPPPKQLRLDGRVTGDIPAATPAPQPVAAPPKPGPSGLPSLEALTTGELVLDKEKPGRPPQYVEPAPYRPIDVAPPSRGRAIRWIVGLLLLGAGVFAAFALFPGLQRQLPLPTPTRGTLIIYSEPSGATVKIAGKTVGETPWAADNLYAGEVKYEISANGYKSRWGTFRGGENVKLDVTLSRK